MPRARRILLSSLIALCASSLATVFPQDAADNRAPVARSGANAPVGQAKAVPNQAQMQQLLKDWERQSAQLKTLDVWIYRIDRLPAWDEETHYEGRAVFKSPQLAYLNFKKIKTQRNAQGKLVPVADPKNPKKRLTTPDETIICGVNEVWQYLHPVHQIFVYPLAKEQRQRALDEGPLPFLFNMKAQEAQARYEMKLSSETPKYYSVVVRPRLREDKEAFRTAQIILDKEWLLPVQIVLISPDNKSYKDFRFEHILRNADVDMNWFQGRPLKNWKLDRNPIAQGQPAANVGLRRGQPAQGPLQQR
jgi:TIGR03009 family protein